jgi:DnaJ-class molecular chaperone
VKIPEQIQRLAIVMAVVFVGVLVTRFLILPRSLIATDLQQASAIEREAARPVKFVGSSECEDCHGDIADKKRVSYHKNLSCEGCHGPATEHLEDESVELAAPRDRKFCPLCHAFDASRPTGFPQINPTSHNPLKPCIKCHNPHDPVPKKVPAECSACHAQIQRTKAVSSHALLACTKCHTVPQRHKTNPRAALPTKPETREFCAKCHAKGATVEKEAPKVDVSTHGGPYLCWECHYPHLPEGRT